MLFIKMANEKILFVYHFILIAIFLPYRRADLAASALLQGIRGEGPQLHVITRSGATW